jgi:hypothetical protein
MRELYCWRCREVVPMLDEEEFARVEALWRMAFHDRGRLRREHGVSLGDGIEALFRPMREEYERITGRADVPQGAILHHRISLYGPPCRECGQLLRTPRASWCAACGATAEPPGQPTPENG